MKRLGGLCFVLLMAVACDDDACLDAACPATGGAANGGESGQGGTADVTGGAPVEGGGGAVIGGSGGEGGEGGGAIPPTLATVLVTEYSGGPGIAFDIVTNEPDGTLADVGVTGVDGTVEVSIPAGGSVSLVYTNNYDWYDPPFAQRNIDTIYFEAEAPDAVHLIAVIAEEPVEATETMAQGFSFQAKPGASSYLLSTSCFSATPTPSVYVKPNALGCTSDGLYDALLLARNASGALVDYARLDDMMFAPDWQNTHTFAWANEPIQTIEFEITNIPSVTDSVHVSTHSSELADGHGPSVSAQASIEDPGNEYSAVLQHLAQYGNHHCQSAGVEIYDGASGRSGAGKSRCGPAPDLSTFALDVSRLTRFEPLPPQESPFAPLWDEAWPGEGGDLLTVYAAWLREDVESVWYAQMAPERTAAPFPELPLALSDYGYLGGDTLLESYVHHQDFDDFNGFDEMVAMGLPLYVFLSNESVYANFYP